MECMIDRKLKKIKNLKKIKLEVVRRYLRITLNIDIGPIGLSRKINRLMATAIA